MKKIVFIISLLFGGLCVAFGQSTIWKSYDINVEINSGIRYMSVVDANTVWAVVKNASTAAVRSPNQFVRTSNGGTFTKGFFLPDTNTYSPSNISAIDSLTAYIAIFDKAADGTSGKIIKTINGGVNWTNASDSLTMFSGFYNFPDFVHFWDKMNGLALGDPNNTNGSGNEFEIWRTNNGGVNWTRVAGANIPNPNSNEYGLTNSYTVYGKRMWFGTTLGRVYSSLDSGKTWNVNTGITGLVGGTQGLAFRDSLHGIIWGLLTTTATTNTYKKTSDGGLTWNAVTPDPVNTGMYWVSAIPGTNSFMSVGPNSGSTAFVTSITPDDGTTWNLLESGITSSYAMFPVQMIDSTSGWAGSFSDTTLPFGKGGMDKYIRYSITAIPTINTQNSSYKIYPNPAQNNFTIETSSTEKQNIIVYDVNGKQVLSQTINSTTSVDASNLSQGVYNISITSNEGLINRRLVIVK